ncbi:MAG: T9SS type A sorting domain-containing protein [Bacteroidota bacterium]
MKKKLLLIIAILNFVSTNAQTIAGGLLDINNIKAAINADGGLFWDNTNSIFEAPNGSGKSTIYASGLWMGGYDSIGQLHLAGQTSRQTGTDFFSGPIDTTGIYGTNYDSTWNRVWKINRCAIDTYENWLLQGNIGSNPLLSGPSADTAAMEVIINWPAFNMFGQPLAPFVDVDFNGFYDPSIGDVPLIKGDQAVFFVYNDARGAHTQTGGLPLGVEIQGMAYAFSCSNDTALFNTIFTNYKIINKSSVRIDSAFIGNWTDTDIGWYQDDYIACDVERGAYYGYNGTASDGSGQSAAYGPNPPAQAVLFLNGGWADPNGIDDPLGTLPNATNCGDGITDNERLGMSRFMCFNNNTNPVNGNPIVGDDAYQFLSGAWRNGTPWTYGGDGTTGSIACDYMYPGVSDSSGFGVGGNLYNPILMPVWDEINVPGDRRGLGSCGPYTLKPGATQEIDFAYVYGRATSGGNLASVDVMKNHIDSIRQKFASAPFNVIEGCGCNGTTGIKDIAVNNTFTIYPNPVSVKITIEFETATSFSSIEIKNVLGQTVKTIDSRAFLNGKNNTSTKISMTIDVSEFSKGLYFVQLQGETKILSKIFVKQ